MRHHPRIAKAPRIVKPEGKALACSLHSLFLNTVQTGNCERHGHPQKLPQGQPCPCPLPQNLPSQAVHQMVHLPIPRSPYPWNEIQILCSPFMQTASPWGWAGSRQCGGQRLGPKSMHGLWSSRPGLDIYYHHFQAVWPWGSHSTSLTFS